MTAKIEGHHIEMLESVRAQLELETDDVVTQQIVIELLALSFASGMKDVESARFVIDSMHKHMLEMLGEITID